MDLNVRLRIYGIVQGVNYRTHTRAKAEELRLSGIVRNEPDGSVYLEAEGPAEQVEKLKEWCKAGPSNAKVEKVEVEEGEIKNFKGFEIKR
ncbi:acylphosphatase [soil metagenome]